MPTGRSAWRILTALVGPALLLASPGCSGPAKSAGEPAAAKSPASGESTEATAVRVAPVRREALSSLYATSTTLRAEKQAAVTARTRGVIRRLLVEEGAQVAEGQELAVLEDEEQRIELTRAEAARDTEAGELERAHELHSKGLLSDEVHETARREAQESAQAAALAALNVARTVIRAPFGGTILRRHVDLGASVADGSAVYDLADLDPLYADVNVPERQVARLARGQTVRLSQDDAAETVVEARIERIAPAVDPATGTIKVTLAVRGEGDLRPGSFVRVSVVTDTHEQTLAVPRSALVAEGRRWHLFRFKPDGSTVEKVEVVPGYEEGDRVEVTGVDGGASALAPGTPVVVVGASALTDGARVRVMDEEPTAAAGATVRPTAALRDAGRGVRVVAV